MHPKYKRIMLKISGEALSGEYGFGLDDKILQSITKQLSEVITLGVEIAMVVGGGNIWRGLAGMGKGIDRVSSDNMGMLATTINSLALQAVMEQNNIQTRVQTAIEMKAFAEPYIRRRAIRHLEKGRVVIFAAGTGNPYFSTDTSAALRAAEIEAEVILMAKKVDGVYDSDPMTNSKAARYAKLSYLDILNENLKVMDSTAVSLCKDNNIPIVVFDLTKPGNILKAVVGEEIGTVIGGAYYAK